MHVCMCVCKCIYLFVCLFVFILNSALFFLLEVVRCQSDVDAEYEDAVEDVTDLGIVGEDEQDYGDGSFSPAQGVDTVCVFPKNSARSEYSIYG